MKPRKKPFQEPSLPSQDESRRANVLREEMLSQFRIFGESLAIVREDVSGINPKLDKLSEKVDVLESAVRTNGQDIIALKEAVQGNTEAIHSMQNDLGNINHRLEVVEARP